MMLHAANVRKRFGAQEVLRGIDLSVEKGDVVAILGPSGSGKTTFLRCLNFLERADQGQLVFDGETIDLHAANHKDISRIRKKMPIAAPIMGPKVGMMLVSATTTAIRGA